MSDQTTPPSTLRAGDSASWSVTLSGYSPAEGWALHYRLLWPAGTAVTLETTEAGESFAVSISAEVSGNWPAGPATLAWWVAKAGHRRTLGHQPITILPNLAVVATFDGRSDNERALIAAKAALTKYLESGRGHVESYTIADRQMKFRSADELRALIEHYERECAIERARANALQGHATGRILTRF
ncbi:hypothetical protein [Thauera propionica]|uniref:hypothetical protein n=1 Tax=Thauera propionica TaxID=2019431 RepID=UPI0023F3F05A|nr:hypothetical protein [Thauera propionica]MDD3674994.1 hypothetical protein [Thauera propionica]